MLSFLPQSAGMWGLIREPFFVLFGNVIRSAPRVLAYFSWVVDATDWWPILHGVSPFSLCHVHRKHLQSQPTASLRHRKTPREKANGQLCFHCPEEQLHLFSHWTIVILASCHHSSHSSKRLKLKC